MEGVRALLVIEFALHALRAEFAPHLVPLEADCGEQATSDIIFLLQVLNVGALRRELNTRISLEVPNLSRMLARELATVKYRITLLLGRLQLLWLQAELSVPIMQSLQLGVPPILNLVLLGFLDRWV